VLAWTKNISYFHQIVVPLTVQVVMIKKNLSKYGDRLTNSILNAGGVRIES